MKDQKRKTREYAFVADAPEGGHAGYIYVLISRGLSMTQVSTVLGFARGHNHSTDAPATWYQMAS